MSYGVQWSFVNGMFYYKYTRLGDAGEKKN